MHARIPRRPPGVRPLALLGLVAFALIATGCSYTKVDPGARQVLVLGPERIADCEKLGKTQVSVADKLGFIPRHDNAVQKDLDILARNSASEMGGDTVTRISEPVNGKQTYWVYDCVDE